MFDYAAREVKLHDSGYIANIKPLLDEKTHPLLLINSIIIGLDSRVHLCEQCVLCGMYMCMCACIILACACNLAKL